MVKYLKEMTKSGMFWKMTNLARSYQRFDKKFKKVDNRDDLKGHLDKWRL